MLHEAIPATPREPGHVHLDLCYPPEAGDRDPLHAHEGEVIAVRWWDRDWITAAVDTADAVKVLRWHPPDVTHPDALGGLIVRFAGPTTGDDLLDRTGRGSPHT